MSEAGEVLSLYRMTRLIRRTQEILIDEYHPADEMRCPIHFCVGQEATPAALSTVLRPDDVVMAHHRSHGYYLAKGGPIEAMIAEFYGRSTGANGGLAGSQELSCEDCNFFSGTILSGMFAMANGSGFAQKYGGTQDITVAVIGDGGMEEGIVFEALNLAAVFALPILFLCENNLYSAHSRIDVRSRFEHLVGRAGAFGVETRLLDGNDPILLQKQLKGIVADRRAGKGPFFLEVQIYRTCGHVGPENDDVLKYRTPEELDEWKQRDPLRSLSSLLLAKGVDEPLLGEIDADLDAKILAALAAAKTAAFPSFQRALELNRSGTYSPLVANLPEWRAAHFDGCQDETRLKPY